jgi:predicted pyridoxine 5'-phosphate oxidase superfamily flavin-nucleotide-binding protein
MEAARIVDSAIATTKRPRRSLLAVAIGVVLVIASKPTVPSRQRLPPRTGGWRLLQP